MSDTLGEYIYEHHDWDDLQIEQRLNVVITYVNDLENEVERLGQRVEELEEYR